MFSNFFVYDLPQMVKDYDKSSYLQPLQICNAKSLSEIISTVTVSL